MVTDSKAKLLESLTDDEKAMVRRVFLTQPLPEKADGATLLLPRSFVADGLMTQAEQNAMFKAVAAKYTAGPLFIKTHPRDTTDYHALFPDAVILERTMPSEVLNFCLPFKFARAVTVQSFVLRGFTAADEKILLTLEEARNWSDARGKRHPAGRFSPPPPAGGAPSQRGPRRLASLCEGGGAERRRERTFPKAPVKGYVQCFTTIEKTYRWQSSFAEI